MAGLKSFKYDQCWYKSNLEPHNKTRLVIYLFGKSLIHVRILLLGEQDQDMIAHSSGHVQVLWSNHI